MENMLAEAVLADLRARVAPLRTRDYARQRCFCQQDVTWFPFSPSFDSGFCGICKAAEGRRHVVAHEKTQRPGPGVPNI